MNFRRTLLITIGTAATLLASQSALANDASHKDALATLTGNLVNSAVAITINELNLQVQKDVLTASHRVEPNENPATYVAKVEVKELKNEG